MPTIRSARTACIAACCALAPPAALHAQPLAIETPATLILPNYERVPIGQREGIEGGAYVARTDDGAANWYNPAGLARARVSAINASANAYEWTSIELEGLGTAADRARFSSIGTIFSVVLAEPVITSDKFRLGFSFTTPVSWHPSRIDAVFSVATPADPDLRVGYTTDVELTQYVPGIAAGWTPGGREGRVRFGAGLAGSYTTLATDQTISARTVTSTAAAVADRRYASSGNVGHVLVNAGVQWDATSRVSIGARVVSPGIRVFGSSSVAYAATRTDATSLADLTLVDDEARFDYKLPAQVDAGLALRFDRGAAEVDVRYHGKVSPYELFGSDVAGRLVQSGATTPPTTSTVPFASAMHEARAVTNVAVGGNYALTKLLRAHAGFATDRSPVASATGSVFRQVDLWHATGGLSLTSRRLSGSVGLGYSSGDGERATLGGSDESQSVSTRLRVRSLSILYALTIGF